MRREFSFVHISDLHYALRGNVLNFIHNPFRRPDTNQKLSRSLYQPTSYDPRRSAAVARFLSRASHRVDAIVLTGDISSTGVNEDLAEAYKFVDSETLTSSVEGVAERGLATRKNFQKVVLLPGNHDRYKLTGNIPPFWHPGGDQFDLIFRDYWSAGFNGVQSRVAGDGKLVFLAADFCLSSLNDTGGSAWRALGRGLASRACLSNLVSATEAAKSECPDAIIIWCIHFCLATRLHSPLELIGRDDVREAAEKCGVSIILAGHMHKRLVEKLSNRLAFIRVGAASSLDVYDDSRLHFVRLQIEGQYRSRLLIKIFDHAFERTSNQLRAKDNFDTIEIQL